MVSSFYPPYHIGGDAMHVKYLAEELAKRGHEVHVLHSIDAYKVKRNVLPKTTRDIVNVYPIQTRFNRSAYFAYLFGKYSLVSRRFETLIDEIKPDVVHHHNISLLGYDLLRKRRSYLNLYTAHDHWLICQRNDLFKNNNMECDGGLCYLCIMRSFRPPQFWRHQEEFNKVAKQIDSVICPSNYLQYKILKKFNVRCVTIPNFVPNPPNKIKPLDIENFFLYAGVLEKHKGVLELVDIYKKFDLETKLFIAGSGSLMKQLSNLIRKNFLKNKIVILGNLNRGSLYRFLVKANAVIVPSLCPENNPLIVLEAMSVGTRVVASNRGGLPEIIEKIDRNLVYNSKEELLKVLKQCEIIVNNPEKIITIYKKNYTPESFIDKYYKLINI